MSKIKPSGLKKVQLMNFKEAQAYAVQYLSDPENKAACKTLCKPGQRPHNVLVSELLKKEQPPVEAIPQGTVFVSAKPRF